MASYTMELRKVCDIYSREEVESWFSSYNLEDYLTEEQIQTITAGGMWSKQKLAKKIVDHYYMREIGLETPYLFRHFAITKMNEIMERKLPLIYSKAIEYDPLVNVDFVEEYSKNIIGSNTGSKTSTSSQTREDSESIDVENDVSTSSSGSSESTSNNTSSGLTVNSDTPQGEISKANILAGNYASSTSANENEAEITDETETSTSSTTDNDTSTSREFEGTISTTGTDSLNGSNSQSEAFRRTMKGNSGSITTVQHLIKQFREIIVGADEEIINELNPLFIGLF